MLIIFFVDSGTQMVKGQFLFILLWFTVLLKNMKPYPKRGSQKKEMGSSILRDGLLPGDSETLRLFMST